MNNQFIQGVIFEWDKIDNDSYIKKIEAFKGIEKIEFTNSITLFVGENGSGLRNGNPGNLDINLRDRLIRVEIIAGYLPAGCGC